jgi:hypothetical protein
MHHVPRHNRFLRALCAVMAVAAVIIVALRPLRADESKRRQLRDEIDRLLADIASELRDVPGDSGTSDLERTSDYAGRVHDKARELKDHIENDSDTRKVADNYPDYARKYVEAARYLREMKNNQRRLDEWPRKCQEATKELASRLRSFTDVHDPRGADEVPRLAREFGATGKTGLELGERSRNEQATWYDRVDDFTDSDGRWSEVRSNLYGAGRSILEYNQRQFEQMKQDDICGNLAKADRNPVVEDAMKKLFEGKKGIELLYEAMDRLLGEAASALDRLEADSNESDIQSADGKFGELERLFDQLDRIKGNDDGAKRRLESWRATNRGAREAMVPLRTLKEAQFRADKAPEKCRDGTDQLRSFLRTYVDKRDTRGLSAIPMKARALSEPIKAGLDKVKEQHPVMERALSEALRFSSSDGKWREVSDKHRAAAAAIFDYWKKAREMAQSACDELAKGDQHGEVLRAVADLSKTRTDADTELQRLQADHRKWYDGLKELREWYKQDTVNVREMFCKLPESPGDSAEGDAYAAQLVQIADRMRDRIRPRWKQLSDDATRLVGIADKLAKEEDDDVPKGALRVKGDVTKVMDSIRNLLDNELNGSNDPDFRSKMEFGKNEHKRIQADSSKCTVSEVTFGSRRVDCIRVSGSTCYVVEIKPNNSEAERRGRKQIDDAIEKIRDELAGKKKSDLSGKLEVLRACFDEASEKANLKEELRVYEYCPSDGALHRDFVIP